MNEAMKFGQLIEYSMRNTFLEKLYTKCGAETIPRPFSILQNICKTTTLGMSEVD